MKDDLIGKCVLINKEFDYYKIISCLHGDSYLMVFKDIKRKCEFFKVMTIAELKGYNIFYEKDIQTVFKVDNKSHNNEKLKNLKIIKFNGNEKN